MKYTKGVSIEIFKFQGNNDLKIGPVRALYLA